MPAAIATNHMTWPVAMGHFSVMTMLFELARGSNTSFHLAILYDLMTRQNWQRCIEEGDPQLKLEEEANTVNKTIMEQACTRFWRRWASSAARSAEF